MTKDKFQTLCEQVLFPRVGGIVHKQLSESFETQEEMARELARIGGTLNQIAGALNRLESHADKR